MLRNKKSMTLVEFCCLIIAIILLVTFTGFGSKIYAAFAKQQYINSYNNLVDKIENVVNSELEEDSNILVLDENEKILFFNKDKNEVILKRIGSLGTPAPGQPSPKSEEFTNTYQKPNVEECKKSCICLCKECKADDKDVIFNNIGNCKEIDGNFVVTETGIVQMNEFKGSITVEGGFFLRRIGPKSRTVYIEKKDKDIGVCFQKPCIKSK